jgi:hypothetical protein
LGLQLDTTLPLGGGGSPRSGATPSNQGGSRSIDRLAPWTLSPTHGNQLRVARCSTGVVGTRPDPGLR